MRRNTPSPQREINDLEPPACFYYALKSVNLSVPVTRILSPSVLTNPFKLTVLHVSKPMTGLRPFPFSAFDKAIPFLFTLENKYTAPLAETLNRMSSLFDPDQARLSDFRI